MSVALYAFATLFCAMVPLAQDHLLRDPATGNLSITYACIIAGLIMLFYAVSGGLWAVLIIDTVQFVVLMVTVLFVVPLIFKQVNGVQGFLDAAPEGFLNLTSSKFTGWFLLGWVVIHTFKFGGEWVFIQRFLAVKDAREAKKSSYLLGALYLISPLIWMLPAMVYRVADPAANPEQAYFLACAAVLPHGMTGLLIAAMFSATASYIDGEINVYAGAITNDWYKPLIKPLASEKELVLAGRVSSFFVGAVIIGGAIAIPYVGGAENVILTITSLLVVPMALPIIWGLFSRKITQKGIWYTTGISFLTAFLVKTLIPKESDHEVVKWLAENAVMIEVGIGVCIPLLTLLVFELLEKNTAEGFVNMQHCKKKSSNTIPSSTIATYPARLLAYSIGVLSLMMYALAFTAGDKTYMVLTFGLVLSLISITILFKTRKLNTLIP
jgi:Na+/proline symporter